MSLRELENILNKNDAGILITRIDHMGDTLLYTPALTDIKAKYPHFTISALANRNTRPILEGNPAVDEIISYEDSYFNTLRDVHKFYHYMRRRNFDIVINFSAAVKDYLESYRLGGKIHVAPVYKRMLMANLVSSLLVNHRIICPDDPGEFEVNPDTSSLSHEVEQNRKISALLKAPSTDGGLVLNLAGEDEAFAEKLLKKLKGEGEQRSFIAIQLSDRWFWEKDSSASLARLIHRLCGKFPNSRILCLSYRGIGWLARKTLFCLLRFLSVEDPPKIIKEVFSCHSEDMSPAVSETITGHPVTFIHNLPLKKFAAVLKKCRFLLTCHSGATHISAAVNTPSAVVFNSAFFNYFSFREKPYKTDCELLNRQITPEQFSELSSQGRIEREEAHIDQILERCVLLNERIASAPDS